MWRAHEQGDGLLVRVEGPQLLSRVAIAEDDPVRSDIGAPQPDVDHAVVLVVTVPVDPLGVGQRIALDLDGDLVPVGEHHMDIGTAFVIR